MIKIEDVKKNYGSIIALQGISMTLEPGFVYGLVGPNGCGKTTLIKSLLGLVRPDSGSIKISAPNSMDGETMFLISPEQWQYRSQIGYLPQNPDFPANMNLNELLELLSDMREQVPVFRDELLKIFSLENILFRPFGELSGGMKQRVAAVCAMSFDSPVLVLDEPTVGLDPLILLPFKKLVRREAQRGKLVILVSHVLLEMEQMADRFIFMMDGRITFSGELKEILTKAQAPNLEEAVVRWLERT